MLMGFLVRALAAAALALVTTSVPLATVQACSCMAFTTPEAIEAADVAFVGTVSGSMQVGRDPALNLPVVRYAFEVERGSAELPPVMEIEAHDDEGGAACGFAFGADERWFVAATNEQGSLRTSLCSGNRLVADLTDEEREQLAQLLPVEPAATPTPEAEAAPLPGGPSAIDPAVVAFAVAGAGLAALAVVVVLALRRPRIS